jgi:hypothetical protein
MMMLTISVILLSNVAISLRTPMIRVNSLHRYSRVESSFLSIVKVISESTILKVKATSTRLHAENENEKTGMIDCVIDCHA